MERRQLKEIKKAVEQHDWKKVQEIAEDLLFQTCIQTRVKRKDWIKFRDEAWKSIQNRKINLIPVDIFPEDNPMVKYEEGSRYQKPKFEFGQSVVWNHCKANQGTKGYLYCGASHYVGKAMISHVTSEKIHHVPYSELTKDDKINKPKYEPGEMVWWEDSYGIFTGTYKFDSYSKSLGKVLLIGLHGSIFKNVPLSELSKINHKAMKP